MSHVWRLALQLRDQPVPGVRTHRGSLLPHPELFAAARSFASPAANALPDRRSYRAGPRGPVSATPSRYSPALSRFPPPALHSRAPRKLLRQAPAMLCGPTCHSVSVVTAPDAHTRPAPCTPATALTGAALTLPPLFLRCRCRCSPHSCSRPPAACLPRSLRAPSLPPRALPRVGPAAPRSLPTRSGSPAPSPDDRSAPQTLSSHLPATGPGLPCGTFVTRAPSQTDRSQTAPPSAPRAASIRAQLPRRRCAVHQPLPPAPLLLLGPARTPADSSAAARSAHAWPRSQTILRRSRNGSRHPNTPLGHRHSAKGYPAVSSATAGTAPPGRPRPSPPPSANCSAAHRSLPLSLPTTKAPSPTPLPHCAPAATAKPVDRAPPAGPRSALARPLPAPPEIATRKCRNILRLSALPHPARSVAAH